MPSRSPLRSPTPKKPAAGARRQARAAASAKPAASEAKWGGVGDAAVKKATGKGWSEWLSALDAAGAAKLSHAEIAELVHSRFKVEDWWAQMVAVGYEQARGLRQKHQKADGFSASASKTMNGPVARAFKAWTDASLRSRWLSESGLEITKATPSKSVRIRWSDGKTRVEVNLYDKGPAKCMVAVQHNKLATAADVARRKAFWSRALDALKAHVEA